MSFSVIIPTMWKYPFFCNFLDDLVIHPLVDEIIIIDNDQLERPDNDVLNNQKIKLISNGFNIFVNPAWNLGVRLAKNEHICVMNDDVLFDTRVFRKVLPVMKDTNFGCAGAHPGEEHLGQIPFRDGSIDLVEWKERLSHHNFVFGFGTLFFVNKSTWFKIPETLSIYYGDDWVHETQRIYDRNLFLITNLFYSSPSAQTCSKIMSEDERHYVLGVEGEYFVKEFTKFKDDAYQNYIESEYALACTTPTDINEHIPTLRSLAEKCTSVIELGVREGWSTRAFLTQKIKLRSYDIVMWPYVAHLFQTMKNIGRDFDYIHASSLDIELDMCDMIFFDTEHTYEQLSKELVLHGNKANKYLVFHDTTSYESVLMPAIDEFMRFNPQWAIQHRYYNNNGLLVLERND